MKKVLILLLFLSPCIVSAQENLHGDKSISFDFGSWRNRYWYPISDLQFRNNELFKSYWGIDMRFRSYGSWFLTGLKSMDFTMIGKLEFIQPNPGSRFWIGVGVDVRLRNNNDVRSSEVNSAEPLLMMEWQKEFGKNFVLRVPLWSRWYSNGMSLTLLPAAEYNMNKRWCLFTRFEGTWLNIRHQKDSEWRRDLFFGLRMQL
jgi:hypothetical protein